MTATNIRRSNPDPVFLLSPTQNYRDVSGSIDSGGSEQVLDESNDKRQTLVVQNDNESGVLRVKVGPGASSTSGFKIKPGEVFTMALGLAPSDQITIWGATTGMTFQALVS